MLQEVDYLLNLSLDFMQARHVIELDGNILGNLELLALLHAHLPHASLRAGPVRRDDHAQYEHEDDRIDENVGLLHEELEAQPVLVLELDLGVPHDYLVEEVEAADLDVEDLVVDLALHLLALYVFGEEELLGHEGDLLKTASLYQVCELLDGHLLGLVSQRGKGGENPNQGRDY